MESRGIFHSAAAFRKIMSPSAKFRLVEGQPGKTASLAVVCGPKTDYAAAAAALFSSGKKELHLVLFSGGDTLPPAAVQAARKLGRKAALHVSAIFDLPPRAAVFKALAGLDLSPYAHIGGGTELTEGYFAALAASAKAAGRFGYRLRSLITVSPQTAEGVKFLLEELPRRGVRYALLTPDPGQGLSKEEEADFIKALAKPVAVAHKNREGDHPPRMQVENTLAGDEAGLRPGDRLFSGGKIYPLCYRLCEALRPALGAAGGRAGFAAEEKTFLEFNALFAALMRGQALQWTDPSENAWITRGLLGGDVYSQRRFTRRSVPGMESVFMFIASGCLNDCIFCQRKISGQKNDLAAINNFIDSNRFIGHPKISILGNEPLLEPAILKIIARARKAGFRRVEVMTSGNLLKSAALCRRLAAAGLTEVSIPLMGSTAKTHDALTDNPGSFQDTVAGIRAAAAAGIKVYTHTNALKQNVRALPGIEAFARETLKTPFCIFSLRPKGPGSMRTPYADLVPSYSEMIKAAAGKVDSLLGFPVCVQRRIQGAAEVKAADIADSVKLYMIHQNYTKPEKCNNCADAASCIGTFRQYTDIYGDAELAPSRRK